MGIELDRKCEDDMKYIKAEWIEPPYEGAPYTLKATGDDGVEYFIGSPDSDVPPWPQFLADGGEIEGEPPPPKPKGE